MQSGNKLNELQLVGLDEMEVLIKNLRDSMKDVLLSMVSLKHGKISWETWLESEDLSSLTSLCEDIVSAGENLLTLSEENILELSDL